MGYTGGCSVSGNGDVVLNENGSYPPLTKSAESGQQCKNIRMDSVVIDPND